MKHFFTSAAIALCSVLATGGAYAATPGIIKKSDLPDWKSRMVEMKEALNGSATRSADAPEKLSPRLRKV